jgi:hypothetical protein
MFYYFLSGDPSIATVTTFCSICSRPVSYCSYSEALYSFIKPQWFSKVCHWLVVWNVTKQWILLDFSGSLYILNDIKQISNCN